MAISTTPVMTSPFTALRGGLTYANVLATGAIFIALGGGAYAVTALPSANSVVFACAKKKGGALRTVTKSQRCKRGERKISWNVGGQAGPGGSEGTVGGSPGPAGVAGAPRGATGPTGASAATPETLPLLSENWAGSAARPGRTSPRRVDRAVRDDGWPAEGGSDVCIAGPADRQCRDCRCGRSGDQGPVLDRPVELELPRRRHRAFGECGQHGTQGVGMGERHGRREGRCVHQGGRHQRRRHGRPRIRQRPAAGQVAPGMTVVCRCT